MLCHVILVSSSMIWLCEQFRIPFLKHRHSSVILFYFRLFCFEKCWIWFRRVKSLNLRILLLLRRTGFCCWPRREEDFRLRHKSGQNVERFRLFARWIELNVPLAVFGFRVNVLGLYFIILYLFVLEKMIFFPFGQ